MCDKGRELLAILDVLAICPIDGGIQALRMVIEILNHPYMSAMISIAGPFLFMLAFAHPRDHLRKCKFHRPRQGFL